MTIYTAQQIRMWDAYTITHEPIASVDLMERAAQKCVQWILSQKWRSKRFRIFCGKGNNGGDGLAIARLLTEQGLKADVYILEFGRLGSPDFQANLHRLHSCPIELQYIHDEGLFPVLSASDLIIDALYGSGLKDPLEGLSAALVEHINQSEATVVSIDFPSGLYSDRSSLGNTVIKADFTLTFQTLKTAFLVAENAPFTGDVQVLDIGLHPGFKEKTAYHLADASLIKGIYRPRLPFSHKGTYGHALIMGGSYGKIGALVLSAKACLRAGAGLVSAYLPKCGYSVLQTAVPEVMTMTDPDDVMITEVPQQLDKYAVIGVGPGLGIADPTKNFMRQLIDQFSKPMVIDADGLNCLSLQKESLYKLPPGSVLTPHPKEFERLFGKTENDFETMERAKQKAEELKVIIVLKGHHTFIAPPDGPSYFNSTGNAGMATGGTGDVLTGIVAALLAQGYSSLHAALMGVYLHGLSGDLAAEKASMEALIASDLIDNLGTAFTCIQ